ncbi:MAG: serine/threonine protein kinase [Planctomycetota bacterium]|nr:MAG: serine/threonine protein kinase [Planctomycetota bacterium]
MNTVDRERLKEILSEAARLSPELRRAYVESATRDHPGLASEAIGLLATLENPAFMAAPTGAGFASPPDNVPPLEAPGTRIGRYKLLQRIGEGGFGVVFMAEQTEPVVRRVALKIIKAGMDTRAVIARFEAERQALAMMDHPNIARVFDGGATEHGRPYFVMELVRGEPVTQYCDRKQLSIEERLSLFGDICLAVQHAHQKGIIHRDLKPSNVLVTMADGRPLPKVIDFGIAKATEVRLTDKTLFTEMHQMVGTPEYMSPEQAEISGIDIDTRSDVYSLGVLLYELLTGCPPFESRRLRSAPLAEIQRIIRNEEPPRPSTRLRALSDSSSMVTLRPSADAGKPSTDASAVEIAERRRTEPMALTRRLRGDLDWIVMKCLEKDRTRRYGTASALAADVSAYLAHLPVSATPPSRSYRLLKMIQRHRRAMLAGGAISATLVVATIVSIGFALKASRALEAEAAQRALADKRAEETRQVAEFQAEMLSGIDVQALGGGVKSLFREQVRESLARRFVGGWPDRRKLTDAEIEAEMATYDRIAGSVQPVDVGRRLLDEYVLGNGVEVVQSKFADQPRVQAELLYTLGVIFRTLGLNDDAEPALRRAVDLRQADATDDDLGLADAMSELAAVHAAKGHEDDAEKLHRAALAIYRERLGTTHEKTITSMDMIANSMFNRGDVAGAEALMREAVALARQLPAEKRYTLAQVLSDLGGALLARRELVESEQLTREALAIRRELFGEEHREVADSLNNLAGGLYNKDDYAGAEETLRRATEIYRKVLGDDHVVVAMCLNNLASTRQEQGDLSSAITLYREALAMYRRLLGDEHPHVTAALNNLAMMYQMTGDLESAEPLLREALDLRRRQLGNYHPDVALSVANLGYQMLKKDDNAAAEPLFREALAIYERRKIPDSPNGLSARLGLAQCLADLDKIDEAESVLRSVDASPGFAGIPEYLRGTYYAGQIKLNEAKNRLAPGQGYDLMALEWRKKAKPAAPTTQTSSTRPAE